MASKTEQSPLKNPELLSKSREQKGNHPSPQLPSFAMSAGSELPANTEKNTQIINNTPLSPSPAPTSKVKDKKNAGIKIAKIGVDSPLDTGSNSRHDNRPIVSMPENEKSHDEDNHSICQGIVYRSCNDRRYHHLPRSQFTDDITPINRQVLSQLLKTLDRESKFNHQLLLRHLDIFKTALTTYKDSESSEYSPSSSDEE